MRDSILSDHSHALIICIFNILCCPLLISIMNPVITLLRGGEKEGRGEGREGGEGEREGGGGGGEGKEGEKTTGKL